MGALNENEELWRIILVRGSILLSLGRGIPPENYRMRSLDARNEKRRWGAAGHEKQSGRALQA